MQKRTYLFHIPKGFDPKQTTPVVLALHGAAMNGSRMAWRSGRNKSSDKEGLIVIYPNGTGRLVTWNAGGFRGKMAEGRSDDVAFLGKRLDDLGTVVKVDEKRFCACGINRNSRLTCHCPGDHY